MVERLLMLGNPSEDVDGTSWGLFADASGANGLAIPLTPSCRGGSGGKFS